MGRLNSSLPATFVVTAAFHALACARAPMPAPWEDLGSEVGLANVGDRRVAAGGPETGAGLEAGGSTTDAGSIGDTPTRDGSSEAGSHPSAADATSPGESPPDQPGVLDSGPVGCVAYDAGPPVGDAYFDPDAATLTQVARLLQNSCALGYCHGRPAAGFWVPFEGSGNLHDILVNRPSNQLQTMSLVTPGDPSHSYLVQKMYGEGLCALAEQCVGHSCGSAMSVGRSELDLVVSWIPQRCSPMIGRLRGELVGQADDGTLTLDVGGVGYEVTVPLGTGPRLERQPDGSVAMWTHAHWPREGEPQLFGFATLADREAFRLVLKVETVGPKIGLAILSSLDAEQLAQTIVRQDASRLTAISGVGRKTAERILLVLKDRVNKVPSPGSKSPTTRLTRPTGAAVPKLEQVRSALGHMGFRPVEVEQALELLGREPPEVELADLIRTALQHLRA